MLTFNLCPLPLRNEFAVNDSWIYSTTHIKAYPSHCLEIQAKINNLFFFEREVRSTFFVLSQLRQERSCTLHSRRQTENGFEMPNQLSLSYSFVILGVNTAQMLLSAADRSFPNYVKLTTFCTEINEQ